MWLCSKHGFFSVKRDAEDRYFIRARVRQDLVNLCGELRDVLGVEPAGPVLVRLKSELPGPSPLDGAEAIQDWSTADYRYRLIVSKQALDAIFQFLADGIDYPNFKSEVARHPDQQRHLPLYQKVWETMAGL